MSQALYLKYRSRNLDEVLGQDHIIEILKSALKKGKISHAYLLTGPRGTGKTSVARILAHEINQLDYSSGSTNLDIIEIDAASNNGVDHIRDLREKARVAPVSAKYKVYIIDEVHMLSKPAFNALLKTLEEPPAHIVFILATTDVDKLPSTILSRVQQYYFRPISEAVITDHLMNIAKKEKFKIEKDAAQLIARYSRGGFRDSISLLDQLSSLADSNQALTRDHVAMSLGLSDESLMEKLLDSYKSGDTSGILSIINKLEEQGADPVIVANQLLELARSRIVDDATYISLIEKLIEVTRHPHPDLKLITILAGGHSVGPAPASKPDPQGPVAPTPRPNPTQTTKPQTESYVKEPEAKTYAKEPAPGKQASKKEEPSIKPEPNKVKPSDIRKIDWTALLTESKSRSMGLFGLLSQCDHIYENSTLTIYAGTVFAQKKLTDARNKPLIGEIIQASHGGEVEVVVISDKKPLEDEKLASIAAVMGGGEEVSLEEIS